jgi:hypothetical protein
MSVCARLKWLASNGINAWISSFSSAPSAAPEGEAVDEWELCRRVN